MSITSSAMQNNIDSILMEMQFESVMMDLPLSDFNVSMMTVGVKIPYKLSGLATLDKDFVERIKMDERFEFTSLSGYDDVKPVNFPNSRALKLVYQGGRKYILMFTNGAFQIMGCKKVTDATLIVDAILRHASYEPVEECDMIADIRMFNSNFSLLSHDINTEAFHQKIVQSNKLCTLDRRYHSGVNVPFMIDEKKVAIVVFPKGNIVITGAKTIEQLQKAFMYIADFMNGLLDSEILQQKQVAVVSEGPKKRGRKRKAVTDAFYESIVL